MPVNYDPVLTDILKDLTRIRSAWTENQYDYAPDAVINYIAANDDALRFFVNELYRLTDRDERRRLCDNHRGLDENIVAIEDPGTLDQLAAVEKATQPSDVYKLSPIIEDDIIALIRPIEYMQHVTNWTPFSGVIKNSPINI